MAKIIHNRIIPFGSFFAINLFGMIFVKKGAKIDKTDLNHELIHTRQQVEMLFLFFYLWYMVEWFVKLIKYGNAKKAYYNLSFEREAYAHQQDMEYLKQRKCYAWWKHLRKRRS